MQPADTPDSPALTPTLPPPGGRYPVAAVEWLVGRSRARVLQLGAGNGTLTTQLCALGHDVFALDSSATQLDALADTAPRARRSLAVPAQIPLATGSVDVVIVQTSTGFDVSSALPESARVLKPGGTIGVIDHTGDRLVPWVKKVYALFDAPADHDAGTLFDGSDLFVLDDTTVFKDWQAFRRDDLVDFVTVQSNALGVEADQLRQRIAAADDLYASYGRGPDGLLMPWMTRCHRGRVAGLSIPADAEPTQIVSQPDVDDGLLVDFR